MVRDASTSEFPNLLAYSSTPCWPFIFHFIFFLAYFEKCLTKFNASSHKWSMGENTKTTLFPNQLARPLQCPLVDIFLLDIDFLCSCSKLFDEFRWNFTWMVDGESCLKQLIFENTHLEQCPLVAIFILPRPFWNFFMLITSKTLHGIQRNFTQVIDGEWCQQQSISPRLQWHPLLAIFIRFLLFSCLFSKLFDQN